MSLINSVSKLITVIHDHENHLLEIENDELEVEHQELYIPFLKIKIKQMKLLLLLSQTKKEILRNMIKEKIKQCITVRMEYATEFVEIEAINENEYLEMSKEFKEQYECF